jgi:sporulation protein YlmC with PRC-barrel domain
MRDARMPGQISGIQMNQAVRQGGGSSNAPWLAGFALQSREARRADMTEATPFTIGADATCTDGLCGHVSRVVVDPVAREVTHLVVKPTHGHGLGRLVPLSLVDASTGQIRLRCTRAEFEKLERGEEKHFLPGSNPYPGYHEDQVLEMAHYGLRSYLGQPGQSVTYDSVPRGEVAVRRGDVVFATDGDIGQVQGLVIDPASHHVTHVLLEEGHLWGRKEVAIPISAVTGLDDGVRLSITKRQVEDLPPVDIDHPGR